MINDEFILNDADITSENVAVNGFPQNLDDNLSKFQEHLSTDIETEITRYLHFRAHLKARGLEINTFLFIIIRVFCPRVSAGT